jgi:CheY-like chemotaxis protein
MGRQFTVLLVDDDSNVRDVIEQILFVQGFNVLIAGDGYEALRILAANHVDVLFTDIVMPGISGYELAAQARLVRPLVRIVYATGYDGDAPGKKMAQKFGKLLRKPIRARELVNEIEDVLQA